MSVVKLSFSAEKGVVWDRGWKIPSSVREACLRQPWFLCQIRIMLLERVGSLILKFASYFL